MIAAYLLIRNSNVSEKDYMMNVPNNICQTFG